MAPPPLNADSVLMEITQLRQRKDNLTAECAAVKQKLHQMSERTNGFTPTSQLDASNDEDAAEIAALEEEVADIETQTDMANTDCKTYELMIERIRGEEKVYRRDLSEIDFHGSAKQSDAKQLQLMLKDAVDVRDAARAELARADETLADELAAMMTRLQEKQAKLAQRRQAAAEHATRTSEKLRALEAERAAAAAKKDQMVPVGSIEQVRHTCACACACVRAHSWVRVRRSPSPSPSPFLAFPHLSPITLEQEREKIQKTQTVFDNIAEVRAASPRLSSSICTHICAYICTHPHAHARTRACTRACR